MGEPAPGPPAQSNAVGVKQKPTTLNLGLGPFYRTGNGPRNNIRGRVNPSPELSATQTQQQVSIPVGTWASESEAQPPPPPAPQSRSRGLRNGGPSSVTVTTVRSPNHGNYNGHGFPLYTPPAPIPPVGPTSSGPGKTRGLSNGLLPHPAPRRPSHIPVTPPYQQQQQQQSLGRGHRQSNSSPPPAATTSPAPSAPPAPSPPRTNGEPLLRRSQSTTGSTAYTRELEPPSPGSISGTVAPVSRHSLAPPHSLWNGQLLHQPLPRRPHSIAATPTTSATNPGVLQSPASGPNNNNNNNSTTTPGQPIQWGASGLVLHQPVPRRVFPASQSQPQPPTPTTSLTPIGNPGNSNTWTAGCSRPRPHSIATTPQTTSAMPPASPSDSGYRSLPPSASSDYQLLKSPSVQTQALQAHSAVRRLSLPSAQTLLRVSAPKPSPTFHGLPFRPFTCGLSPNGNPIFLGCTHLHGPGRVATPITSPAKSLTTSQAIQQLLAQPRNGFKIVDDKVSLFIEILDTQERFAKVSQTRTTSHA